MDAEELITTEEAARHLGLKPSTLLNWRSDNRGPAFFKIGRLVYYRRSDLEAWVSTQRRVPVAA